MLDLVARRPQTGPSSAWGNLQTVTNRWLPSVLWPLGTEAGMWLDPSDAATGWQASDGLTANVLNSPIGLRYDKRLGSPLGPELVTNGTFDTVTTGWAPNEATLAVVAGELQLTTAGVGGFNTSCSQTIATVSGTTYTIKGRLYKGTCANSVSINIGVSTAGSNATTTPTDISFTYTATGATAAIRLAVGGNETGTTAYFDNITVKAWNGNHVLQATSASRPLWKLNGAIYSDLLDGVDDGYSTATFGAGTLINGMDCFFALKRNSAAQMVPISDIVGGTKVFAEMVSAGGGPCFSGIGTNASHWVNGVQIGTTNNTTTGQMDTAVPNGGGWKVIELHDLDLSTWTQFTVGLYTAFMLSADIGGIILCPAQSTGNRNSIRTYLGAKVGLSL